MKGAKLPHFGAGVGVGDASIRSLQELENKPSHLTFAGAGAVAGPLAYKKLQVVKIKKYFLVCLKAKTKSKLQTK